MKQIRKPFNIVMALILLIVVTIATIAFSSWLITDEITEKPIYQPGTVAKYYLDNQKDIYDGTSQAPTSPLFAEGELSYQYRKSGDTDYISGKPTNAGIYDIRVTIKENNEKVDVGYQIKPKPFSNKFTVQVKGDKFVHTGTAITPKITLMDGTTTLIEGTDYTLDYENNIALGNAKIIITGIGNYEGTLNQEFTIVGTSKLEIVCTNMQQLTYNGKSQLPEYTVKCGSDVITDAIVEIQYRDPNTGEYIDGQPMHAGVYTIRLTAKKEGYEDSDILERKVTINPKEVTVTWENLNFTYNGQIQKPTGTLTGLIDGDSCVLSISADDNKNAGTYTARATIGSGENMADYKISNASTQYVIGKKDIRVSNTIVEIDYKSGLTWANLKSELAGMVSYDGIISGDSITATISGMHNGIFGYGTDEKTAPYTIVKLTGDAGYTNVIGSTYLVTISVSDSELTNYNLKSNTFIFKYKTAILGTSTSKYYTVEDAFSKSGDINFVGDSTGKTSFVTTSFCNLSIGEGYPYSGYTHTVSNRKLVVPYKSTYLSNLDSPKTASGSSGNVYAALIVGDKIQINVGSSGNILVDAEIGFAQPNTTITCTRGVLLNLGTINIKTGSKVYAYGFLKGFDNGLLELESGAEAKDCFHTYDWPGGNTATKIYESVLPLNAWSLHNISCTTKINYGANYSAYMYANIGGSDVPASMYVIRSDTSKSSMFVIKSGYIIKSATHATLKSTDTTLNTIVGKNQENGQKDMIDIYGNCEDASFQITVSGNTIKTSKDIACPIGYMDITIKSGSQLLLANSDYLFLPGTTLTIDENAVLTTDSGVDLSFEIVENIKKASGGYAFVDRYVDKFDAKLIVNGTFNCKGGVGGLITTSNLNGKIKFDSTANVCTTFLSLYNGFGATSDGGYAAYKVTDFYGKAYINDISSYSSFVVNNEYTVAITDSGEYYWVGAKGTTTSLDGTFNSQACYVSGCFATGSLITMADGTQKPVEQLKPGDLVLVYNHTTGKFDVAPIMVYFQMEERMYQVLNLKFENGTVVKVLYGHTFVDASTNKYVEITANNVEEYLNHKFYNIGSDNKLDTTTLVAYEITTEYTGCYSIFTAVHYNHFVDGMLAFTDDFIGIVNIFEMTDGLKYDEELKEKDINKYGLYTYDEWSEYLSYEEFVGFNVAELKVAVGKGYITKEEIIGYILHYKSYSYEG